MASNTQSGATRASLLAHAQSFASAFANKTHLPSSLVSEFFSIEKQSFISAFEHGLLNAPSHHSSKLPFLGNTSFTGAEGVQRYFETVGSVLDYDAMEFPEEGGFSPFVVDVEGRQVGLKGRAKFSCKETGEGWDETFMWKLAYNYEGDKGWRVVRFEVWADPVAAYLATKGELSK